MTKTNRKLIAPIIITVFLVCYFLFFGILITVIHIPLIAKILGAIIPLALCGVSVFVLIERIKEVRSGEENDLSKY